MSKIKVDTIQHTQHSNSTISLSNAGVTVNGNCTASSFTGDGANLTNLPVDLTQLNAQNLTSGTIPDARIPNPLPAIDGSALTGISAGGFEFVKKITTSQPVAYIDETGLDYDRLYRFVLKRFSFTSANEIYIHPFVDNETSPVNRYGCQNINLAYGPTHYSRGGNNEWQFYNGTFWYTKQSGFFDLYTGSHAWIHGNINSYPSTYGYCLIWGDYNYSNSITNTNNDPNQTDTYAKVNGFRLRAANNYNIDSDLEILVYKYAES